MPESVPAKLTAEEVVLVRPQSFYECQRGGNMLPGGRYKIKPDDLIVIHDDIDLPLGRSVSARAAVREATKA